MEQRDNIDFKNTNIRKLFFRFLLPTVLGMVSSAIFIITDGIFVGRGIGSDALAAVNLIAPLYTLATGLGLMFGMGSSVVASVNLSRGKSRVAGINITQALIVPSLLLFLATILLLVFCEDVMLLLGTPTELLGLGREYYLSFVPFLMPLSLFYILMFAVRLSGAPNFVMYCNILAAGLNILLDYIFIFVFNWGLMGAAVATGIGYVVGALIMLWYMLYRSHTLKLIMLKLSLKSLQLTARNIGYMIYVGFPVLLSELAISAMMVVGNYVFIRYLGKDGVAAYGVACYIFPIIFMIHNGVIQAAQPIISYNYGAGSADRVRKAFGLAVMTAIFFGLLICGATWWGGDYLVGFFLKPDAPAYPIATEGLRWFSLGYAFFGINVVVTGCLQSLEWSKVATAITVLRGIILMWICFEVLPTIWGEQGIWLSVPVAELITTLVIFVVYFVRMKMIAKKRSV